MYNIKDAVARQDIANLDSEVDVLRAQQAHPIVASSLTNADTTKIYIVPDANDDNKPHWYHYNGSTWVNDGVWGSVIPVDDKLEAEGAAADAKATGDAIGDLKNAIINDNILGAATWNVGFVKYDGSLNTINNSYRYSNLFPVLAGERYYYQSTGNGNLFILAMYTDDTTVSLSESILGDSNLTTDGYITIPNNVKYLRVSCPLASLDTAIMTKTTTKDSTLYEVIDKFVGEKLSYGLSNGYVKAADGSIISTSGYRYSDFISVNEGDAYQITSYGSSSVFTVAMYANQSSDADTTKSIIGANAVKTIAVTIPAGISFIRVTCGASFVDSLAVYRLGDYSKQIAALDNAIKSNSPNYLLKKRKATVSFIFDDGVANDASIKAIFDTHGMKCGFAVYGTIASRYIDYHEEGFEILAHDTTLASTEADIKQQLLNCYNNVVASVGECYGWVTPSSNMPEVYRPLVYDIFEYGYTVSKGNVATPSDACMEKTLKSYGLWRSSLQTLTLAENKAILDYAIANNLMVCYYGHAAQLDTTDNLTTENLNALLTYCTTSGVDVVLPHDSVSEFFAYRHNED